MTSKRIYSAVSDLKEGKMVMIYDGEDREGETDLVLSSEFMTPEKVALMRNDAGGLICVAIHPKACDVSGDSIHIGHLE